MPEIKANLTGWQAIIALIILLGVMVFRLVTLNENVSDQNLTGQMKLRLQMEYIPDQVAGLKQALQTGEFNKVTDAAKTAINSELFIESVKASYPLLDFASTKQVIIKVNFNVASESEAIKSATRYYRFNHGGLANSWQYESESNAISYYLNFI